MDEFDRASELEQRERDACVAAARNRRGLLPCGFCYNCEEPLPAGRLFCDTECRDDYEKRVRKK